MIATAEMENARACGIAALDEAERDILSARPRAAIAPEGDRLALSRKLRLEFARECHVSTKGRPLDFSEPWLWPIYDDDSEVKVLMKSVQCGISEFNIITTLADAAAGRVVLYVLPTFDVRNRFVDQRVNRAMLLVPRYQQMMYEAIGNVDNKGFKNFGPGSIYFVSADTERSFVEIAAETLIVDEVDKCDQDNLVMAPDRLEGTDKRFRRRIDVGNPTHNEFGISARFLESDQREWQVKCRACATWQTLDFFANVLRVERDDKGEIRRYELRDAAWQKHLDRDIGCYCVKCGAALDRLERDGKFCGWHAMNPGHAITGWHISKLMAARSQVRDIYLAWCGADGDPSETARVFNSLLGLSYSPAGSTLTDDLLNGCAKDFDLAQNAEGPCTMGIDVGRTWDVRISDAPEPGIRRARLIGRFNGPEPCLDLIKRFHVTSCVIDARPETRLAIEFQKMAPRNVVWRCDFAAGESIREPKKDEKEGTVRVDRTGLLDAATSDILNRRNWLPRAADKLIQGEYYKQMKAPKRVLIESPSGERYIWTKAVDHQRLADAYDKLAGLIRRAAVSLEFLILGGDAATPAPKGWQR